MNLIVLSGRTTKENDLKITPNGKEVLNQTIAVKRDFKNANGEYESDFVNLVLFGSTAKFISDYAPKGSLIEVKGRWQHRSYQDNQGNTRYVDECIVDNASLLIKNETSPKEETPFTNAKSNVSDNPFGVDDDYGLPF